MKKPLELLSTATPKSDLNKPKKVKKKISNPIKQEITHTSMTYLDVGSIRCDPKVFYTPYRQKFQTEEYFQQIGAALKNWARTDSNAFRISQFLGVHDIPYRSFTDWVAKSPQLRQDVDDAKLALADRREIGAIKKEFDSGMIKATLGLYDREYKEEQDRKAVLAINAKAEAEKKEDQHVYLYDLIVQDTNEEVQ